MSKKKATIVKVQDDYSVAGPNGYSQRYRGYVQAKDEDGCVYNFSNGSLNRVLDAKVGDKGYVEYVRSASMGLWYWRKGEMPCESEPNA